MQDTSSPALKRERCGAQADPSWAIALSLERMHARLPAALALVAALLLGAGLIFGVAAHWAQQTRSFQLHLLQAAVALPWGCALLPGLGQALRGALVWLGLLAVGGLLAFIGITYQTGADAWQLFATWAALGLPAVWVLRRDGLWALWLLIAALALGSWSGQALLDPLDALWRWSRPHNLVAPFLWLALFAWPLVLGVVWPVRDARGAPGSAIISQRLAAMLALAAWSAQAVAFLWWSGSGADRVVGYTLPAGMVLLAAVLLWRSRWRDPVGMGLALLAINGVGLALLAYGMFSTLRLGLGGLLLFGLLAAVCVGLSTRALFREVRHGS